MINQLKEADKILFRYKNLNIIEETYMRSIELEHQEAFKEKADQLKKYFEDVFILLPRFAKYDEKPLLDIYVLDNNYKTKINSEYISLQRLMHAAKITFEDFDSAVSGGSLRYNALDRIRRGIRENIEIPFNQFYTQEKINLNAEINGNSFTITIRSGDEGVVNVFSERSQGLKWYLNFFIWMVENNLQDRKVFFLIDEPGISLHVQAQKELLRLFKEHLGVKHQVLFATHSPFMLDADNISSVRVVQKVNNRTEIIKSPYSSQVEKSSKVETLSPLLNALGMRISDQTTIDWNKINVITEGISDFLYLKSMSNLLKYTEFNFIPASGADNEKHVASILWGWGLRFICLFDNDNAGRRAAFSLRGEFDNEIIAVSIDCDFTDDSQSTIETLIGSEDQANLDLDYSERHLKIISAHKFVDIVNNKAERISSETRDNFNRLFEFIVNSANVFYDNK